MQLLTRFEEYCEFRTRTRAGSSEQATDAFDPGEPGHDIPLEAIAEAVRDSTEALATDVLRRVLDQKPTFLERLVLALLTAMATAAGPVRRSIGAVPVTVELTVWCGKTFLAWIEPTCRPSATPPTMPWGAPTCRGLSVPARSAG